MPTTQELHQQAERFREQDRHLEALKLYEEVVVAYRQEKNYSDLVEALGGRCLTYKHLFLLTDDVSMAIVANHSAIASLEIAQRFKLNNKIYRCHFRLGEMAMLFKDYQVAIDHYQQALSLYPRPEAERGDFQYHLGEAQYQAGLKQEGKKNLIDGVKEIEKHQTTTDSFVFNVWRSGGYMRLAQALWTDSPVEASRYLDQAQSIIQSDDRLIIRKRQLEELKRILITNP